MTTDITAALIEQVEAEGYAEFTAAASAAARTALGTQQLRIGGGVALALPNDPSGFFSKTIGLGFDEPVTGQLIERVIAFYRAPGHAVSEAAARARGAAPGLVAGLCEARPARGPAGRPQARGQPAHDVRPGRASPV